mgnify:CR=1 FL=1
MCKRVYLTAKEAEKEMQEARKADGFKGQIQIFLILCLDCLVNLVGMDMQIPITERHIQRK